MDTALVQQLASPQGRQALAAAGEHADADGLTAAVRMRADFGPELAAAALTQVGLRRRAATKFGAAASGLLFTRDGLEQASRPEVAAHHAARFLAAGVHTVLDLGCGIGTDSLALSAAGLRVVAVEQDPVTAAIARFNCGDRVEVVVGRAEEAATRLGPGVGAFCDPARRSDAGRLWRVTDFSPPWSFVQELLASGQPSGVKLGPALPHELVPEHAEAEWVSQRGDTVEVGLWAGAGAAAGSRAALLLPADRLVLSGPPPELAVAGLGAYLYEPDGAVIRAGGVTTVGQLVHGALLDPKIAYLTSDVHVPTPYATAFRVVEALPYKEKVLRGWLADQGIGSLEIKKRGLDVDPAALRRRLRLSGPRRATLVLTRTRAGALAVVADRVVPDA